MFYFCLSDSLCLPFSLPSQFEHYLMISWEMIVWVLPFSVARIFPQSFWIFQLKSTKIYWKKSASWEYKSTFLCWKTSMKEPKLRRDLHKSEISKAKLYWRTCPDFSEDFPIFQVLERVSCKNDRTGLSFPFAYVILY